MNVFDLKRIWKTQEDFIEWLTLHVKSFQQIIGDSLEPCTDEFCDNDMTDNDDFPLDMIAITTSKNPKLVAIGHVTESKNATTYMTHAMKFAREMVLDTVIILMPDFTEAQQVHACLIADAIKSVRLICVKVTFFVDAHTAHTALEAYHIVESYEEMAVGYEKGDPAAQ